MRIQSVKKNEKVGWDVSVKFNWLEKLFGAKDKLITYRDSGRAYLFGNQTIYTDKDGNTTSNYSDIAEAIDTFRRKW